MDVWLPYTLCPVLLQAKKVGSFVQVQDKTAYKGKGEVVCTFKFANSQINFDLQVLCQANIHVNKKQATQTRNNNSTYCIQIFWHFFTFIKHISKMRKMCAIQRLYMRTNQ